MKVGDVKDRLYWDVDEGKYMIEKNIISFLATRVTRGIKETGDYISFMRLNGILSKTIFSGKYDIIDSDKYESELSGSDWVIIRVKKDFYYKQGYKLTESDANRFLKDYPVNIFTPLAKPDLIETDITERIELPSYNPTTHIIVNSGNIEPSNIKALVPMKASVVTDGLDCDFYLKNKSFNGVSDYIDTDLNLLDIDADWCIYINFTDLGLKNKYQNIIHNMSEVTNYPGISVAKRENSYIDFLGAGFTFGSIINLNTTPDVKIVFFRRASKIGYKTINNTIVERDYTLRKTDKNLLIGCYQTLEGVKGRFWKGIVHELIVYKNKTITDQEIDYLLERGE